MLVHLKLCSNIYLFFRLVRIDPSLIFSETLIEIHFKINWKSPCKAHPIWLSWIGEMSCASMEFEYININEVRQEILWLMFDDKTRRWDLRKFKLSHSTTSICKWNIKNQRTHRHTQKTNIHYKLCNFRSRKILYVWVFCSTTFAVPCKHYDSLVWVAQIWNLYAFLLFSIIFLVVLIFCFFYSLCLWFVHFMRLYFD